VLTMSFADGLLRARVLYARVVASADVAE